MSGEGWSREGAVVRVFCWIIRTRIVIKCLHESIGHMEVVVVHVAVGKLCKPEGCSPVAVAQGNGAFIGEVVGVGGEGLFAIGIGCAVCPVSV